VARLPKVTVAKAGGKKNLEIFREAENEKSTPIPGGVEESNVPLRVGFKLHGGSR